MRDSELIREFAEKLFEDLKRYIPEEDHDFVFVKIETAMLKAHIDVSSNVHDDEGEDG